MILGHLWKYFPEMEEDEKESIMEKWMSRFYPSILHL
jgi:hypothetical protein